MIQFVHIRISDGLLDECVCMLVAILGLAKVFNASASSLAIHASIFTLQTMDNLVGFCTNAHAHKPVPLLHTARPEPIYEMPDLIERDLHKIVRLSCWWQDKIATYFSSTSFFFFFSSWVRSCAKESIYIASTKANSEHYHHSPETN